VRAALDEAAEDGNWSRQRSKTSDSVAESSPMMSSFGNVMPNSLE
jgi:hypothetical protein